MVALSSDFGITWDEEIHNRYGRAVVDYYRSGFTDRTAFGLEDMHLYGALFDSLCVLANHISPLGEYETRHLLNAVFGWLGILFAGLLARRHFGLAAGLLTLALLLLSPRYLGHCFNNPKDIPFSSLYIIAVYYLLALRPRFPHLTRGLAVTLTLVVALALSVRVGGVMLLCYLGAVLARHALAERQRDPRKLATLLGLWLVLALASMALGTLFSPWAQWPPVVRTLQVLTEVSRFEWNHEVLFGGQYIMARDLPWDYIPRLYLLTTPLPVLAGLAAALAMVTRAGARRWPALALLLAAALPVLYVIAVRAVLYDGIRHLLFIYPALVALAAAGWCWLLSLLRPRARLAAAAALALLLLQPLAFELRNHPNHVVYFNPLAGGVAGANQRYHLDYWGNCMGQAVGWIRQQARRRKARVRFSTNKMGDIARLYAQQDSGLDYLDRGSGVRGGNYHVFLTRGPHPAETVISASDQVLYTVKVDGAPLCHVLRGSEGQIP